jgi:class 3 adenylate cyclase
VDQELYLAALCRAVPYHIVERALHEPTEAALAYRNEPGSVLFADLVSFTSMCERIAKGGPERLGRLSQVLNELFTGFELEAFFPFGGYIVEFGGDAMLVVFLGEGHSLRCAAAALRCQDVVARVAAGVLGEESRDLRLRVGVAAGSVRLSVLGDLTRRLTTCSGATAHDAIGLQQRAAPGEILADDATASALDDVAELHRLPGRGVRLSGLRAWPERESVVPLDARTKEHTREKIELLEPFVPAPLARRLRAMPGGLRIEAEIRRPVILFADVLGFPEDPATWARPPASPGRSCARSRSTTAWSSR